jgi:uncharacterized iron-regulated protein
MLTAVMPIMACSTVSPSISLPENPPPPWNSKFETDHNLVGRIWQPALNRYIQTDQVQKIVREADFVLLGEKHDNIDHHRIQTWLIKSAFERGRASPVAFEMITTDWSGRLEKYQTDNPGNARQLGSYLQWEKSGWPAWSMYQPIAQAALAVGAPLTAAGQPRQQIQRIFKQGVKAGLGSATYARLGLEYQIPPTILAAKRREIIASHCNKLPKSMVDPMVQVQHVKDASMAHILIDNDMKYGGSGGVLIAGGGHVRNDYGVPWHLKRAAPDKSVLTIGMIEVSADLTEPRQYAVEIGTAILPFDLVWFTPRSDNTNPCERYSRQLKNIGKKK